MRKLFNVLRQDAVALRLQHLGNAEVLPRRGTARAKKLHALAFAAKICKLPQNRVSARERIFNHIRQLLQFLLHRRGLVLCHGAARLRHMQRKQIKTHNRSAKLRMPGTGMGEGSNAGTGACRM